MDRRDFIKYLVGGSLAAGVGYVIYSMYLTPPEYEAPIDQLEYTVLATGLEIPWAVRRVGSDYLVTERSGRLTLVRNGGLNLVASFDVARVGEAGLLGLELDPEFESNRRIYLYMSIEREPGVIVNRVVRAKLSRDYTSLDESTVILDDIPGANIHDGGRLRIGVDGYLYVTTGDANNPNIAQDPDNLGGKILRIELDGSPAPDNPFDNEVYSLGHRNPQGLDWDPSTGDLYSSEHGPIGHDEINRIVKGGNYGWPIYAGYSQDPRYVSPVFETGNETIAPSGASFIPGSYLGLSNPVFTVACLRGSQLFIFDPRTRETYSLFRDTFGRVREAYYIEDLGLILATSNRDGRGVPREGDDKLILIPPP